MPKEIVTLPKSGITYPVSKRIGSWVALKHKYGYQIAVAPEIGGEAATVPDRAIYPGLRSGRDFISYRQALTALAFIAGAVPEAVNNHETAVKVGTAFESWTAKNE